MSGPAESFSARLRLDMACGLSLLTQLPTGWLLSPAQRVSTAPWPMGRSIWCWPLIGAVIGALIGAIFCLLRLGHVAPLPAAGLALAVQCVLTGGLHEDGLADLADGCGGPSRERRLEIMRDSRIGSYGVLALSLSLLVRASSLAALPAGMVLLALVVSGCLARAALLVLPAFLTPARPDGLARSLSPLPRTPFWLGLILAGASVGALAWLWADGPCVMSLWNSIQPSGKILSLSRQIWPHASGFYDARLMVLHIGLLSVAATLAACGLVTVAARRLLGGYTGDVLGAVAVLTECFVLASFTTLL
ncbi:adenosylcobinamide-GDP ribazoletransferase [Acetobacter orleanensis]|nr:adenosylcobinamide-GDP ribazoletransferase [Acetobacter orleanensis]